jgi:hypothetical protein
VEADQKRDGWRGGRIWDGREKGQHGASLTAGGKMDQRMAFLQAERHDTGLRNELFTDPRETTVLEAPLQIDVDTAQ